LANKNTMAQLLAQAGAADLEVANKRNIAGFINACVDAANASNDHYQTGWRIYTSSIELLMSTHFKLTVPSSQSKQEMISRMQNVFTNIIIRQSGNYEHFRISLNLRCLFSEELEDCMQNEPLREWILFLEAKRRSFFNQNAFVRTSQKVDFGALIMYIYTMTTRSQPRAPELEWKTKCSENVLMMNEPEFILPWSEDGIRSEEIISYKLRYGNRDEIDLAERFYENGEGNTVQKYNVDDDFVASTVREFPNLAQVLDHNNLNVLKVEGWAQRDVETGGDDDESLYFYTVYKITLEHGEIIDKVKAFRAQTKAAGDLIVHLKRTVKLIDGLFARADLERIVSPDQAALVLQLKNAKIQAHTELEIVQKAYKIYIALLKQVRRERDLNIVERIRRYTLAMASGDRETVVIQGSLAAVSALYVVCKEALDLLIKASLRNRLKLQFGVGKCGTCKNADDVDEEGNGPIDPVSREPIKPEDCWQWKNGDTCYDINVLNTWYKQSNAQVLPMPWHGAMPTELLDSYQ